MSSREAAVFAAGMLVVGWGVILLIVRKAKK